MSYGFTKPKILEKLTWDLYKKIQIFNEKVSLVVLIEKNLSKQKNDEKLSELISHFYTYLEYDFFKSNIHFEEIIKTLEHWNTIESAWAESKLSSLKNQNEIDTFISNISTIIFLNQKNSTFNQFNQKTIKEILKPVFMSAYFNEHILRNDFIYTEKNKIHTFTFKSQENQELEIKNKILTPIWFLNLKAKMLQKYNKIYYLYSKNSLNQFSFQIFEK